MVLSFLRTTALRRLVQCGFLVPVLVPCGLVLPAGAQLSGTWEISADVCCTDDDGESHCDVNAFGITVTQNGNRLSGAVVLPGEPSEECSVTCTPPTPNCARRIDLAGTVSGRSVDVMLSSSQVVRADCGVCVFHENYSEVVHLQGVADGTIITGSVTDRSNYSCTATGDPECSDLIECVGSTCSGTFQISINGASPTPSPTPSEPTCSGDCNGDHEVTVNELITMVNITLGNTDLSVCTAGDADSNGEITITEIITAVNKALGGCQ